MRGRRSSGFSGEMVAMAEGGGACRRESERVGCRKGRWGVRMEKGLGVG